MVLLENAVTVMLAVMTEYKQLYNCLQRPQYPTTDKTVHTWIHKQKTVVSSSTGLGDNQERPFRDYQWLTAKYTILTTTCLNEF